MVGGEIKGTANYLVDTDSAVHMLRCVLPHNKFPTPVFGRSACSGRVISTADESLCLGYCGSVGSVLMHLKLSVNQCF